MMMHHGRKKQVSLNKSEHSAWFLVISSHSMWASVNKEGLQQKQKAWDGPNMSKRWTLENPYYHDTVDWKKSG